MVSIHTHMHMDMDMDMVLFVMHLDIDTKRLHTLLPKGNLRDEPIHSVCGIKATLSPAAS